MKVCSVPYSDGSKLRCWAYLPVAILNEFGELNNLNTLEIGDEYYQDSIKELNTLIKENKPQELRTHCLVAEVDSSVTKLIARELENPQDIIKNRIVSIN